MKAGENLVLGMKIGRTNLRANTVNLGVLLASNGFYRMSFVVFTIILLSHISYKFLCDTSKKCEAYEFIEMTNKVSIPPIPFVCVRFLQIMRIITTTKHFLTFLQSYEMLADYKGHIAVILVLLPLYLGRRFYRRLASNLPLFGTVYAIVFFTIDLGINNTNTLDRKDVAFKYGDVATLMLWLSSQHAICGFFKSPGSKIAAVLVSLGTTEMFYLVIGCSGYALEPNANSVIATAFTNTQKLYFMPFYISTAMQLPIMLDVVLNDLFNTTESKEVSLLNIVLIFTMPFAANFIMSYYIAKMLIMFSASITMFILPSLCALRFTERKHVEKAAAVLVLFVGVYLCVASVMEMF